VLVPVRIRFKDRFGRPVSFRAIKRVPTLVEVNFIQRKGKEMTIK
jgi:hypothetical protein